MIFNNDEDFIPVRKKLSIKEELIIWSMILIMSILLGLIIWASLNRII